jgi:prepilin-type N-terminal cleavage/methylation domain-containing protein
MAIWSKFSRGWAQPEQFKRLDEAGFTLTELLVALAVLGMAATMVGAALNSAWLAMPRRGPENGDQSVAAAQHILRTRLEHLSAVVRLDSSNPIVDAQGDSRVMSFAAPPFDALHCKHIEL